LIYIDRFLAKNSSRYPDFMNNLDKLKSKKYSLEQSLKKYKHKTAEMTNALALTEFLEISRKFIEKQSKVDEEDKET
jgi:hypothetical protein